LRKCSTDTRCASARLTRVAYHLTQRARLTRKKLGDSPANLLINQGGYGHTTRVPPGVSLPSGSRTRNLQILDPAFKPLRCSGDTQLSAQLTHVGRRRGSLCESTRVSRARSTRVYASLRAGSVAWSVARSRAPLRQASSLPTPWHEHVASISIGRLRGSVVGFLSAPWLRGSRRVGLRGRTRGLA
jgi:hypothetical protein